MTISYPRQCHNCKRRYGSRSSFSKHIIAGTCEHTQQKVANNLTTISGNNPTVNIHQTIQSEQELQVLRLENESLQAIKIENERLQALRLEEEIQAIRLENEQLRASSTISGPLDHYDGGLYIVQTARFSVSKQQVYKVGRTDDIRRRTGQYEKGSRLLFYSVCVQHIRAETEIKKKFVQLFKARTDIGSEYFEGDLDSMIKTMSAICEVRNENLSPRKQ